MLWDGETDDATPDFNIDFDDTVLADDNLRLEYDTDSDFPAPTVVNHTITAGEITAGELDLALSELVSGTYYFRARFERGGILSAWSNVEEVTLDVAFSPADFGADLLLWLEADDLTTLWQEIAGSTQVSADGQTVGKWDDKSGDGFHLTAVANDTTRPVYHTAAGLHWVQFDGSNDVLRRLAELAMYDAGACSIFIAMSGDPASGRTVFGEFSSADADTTYRIRCGGGDPDDALFTIINDAGSTRVDTLFADEVFDASVFVLGVTDSGTDWVGYDNGVQSATGSYTRSGTVTADRTSLGASFNAGSAGNQCACSIYAIVVVGRVIDATERADLVTYLGEKVGLTL